MSACPLCSSGDLGGKFIWRPSQGEGRFVIFRRVTNTTFERARRPAVRDLYYVWTIFFFFLAAFRAGEKEKREAKENKKEKIRQPDRVLC